MIPNSRRLNRVGLWVVLAIIVAELAGRMIGLGDPPLILLDPHVEYYLVPNQSGRRFGQVYRTNRLGMRSDDASLDRLQGERSVALFGDSIVFGSGLDQDETIGFQLQVEIRKAMSDEAWIVNAVAASSWGPENILAFYRRIQPMRGALAVVIQSTHDIVDIAHDPSVPPPDRISKPYGALHDALMSVGRAVSFLRSRAVSRETYEGKVMRTTRALDVLLTELKADYRRVVLVFHPDAIEVMTSATGGDYHFREVASRNGVGFVSNLNLYHHAYSTGLRPHSDDIHLSVDGAKLVSRELMKIVENLMTYAE